MNISSIAATIRAALIVVLIAACERRVLYIAKRAGPAVADVQARTHRPRDRRAVDAARAAHAARGGRRDTRFRQPRPGAAGQRQLSQLCRLGQRRYVVWNVVAAPEFSVDPKQWCYPIVGCVAYRGYFVEARARRFAARACTAQGFDVTVGGVAAYSTLGHFDDPVLNTMMDWNDVELAAIIFHELTHQLLYVPDDSSFNEALATTVEEEGVRRWLRAQGRDADLAKHLLQQEHYLKVIDLLSGTRAELRAVYASGLTPQAHARAQARRIRSPCVRLSQRSRPDWGGHAPFDPWFAQDLNNAQLASIATYYACVPGFERELAGGGRRPRCLLRPGRARWPNSIKRSAMPSSAATH